MWPARTLAAPKTRRGLGLTGMLPKSKIERLYGGSGISTCVLTVMASHGTPHSPS